ncbi:hypothetical protein JRQ81_008493 [Phrynocephalus forsythii]|uniref:Uncharacterized protein n=1 Tax=Phrynocephalus forsythii TaxID=171643 RepID=A0A9Q0XC50_9SAUR|nr:hypothetical protein JRQ81_008493 [Phrynocephalus forsythii]
MEKRGGSRATRRWAAGEIAENELRLYSLHRPLVRGRPFSCHGDGGHSLHEPLPHARHRVPAAHQHQPRRLQRLGHHRESRQFPHQHLHRPQLSQSSQRLHPAGRAPDHPSEGRDRPRRGDQGLQGSGEGSTGGPL